MSIDRNYIRQELQRCIQKQNIDNDEPYMFSAENYIRHGISSKQVEQILTKDSGSIKNWMIRGVFKHKEGIKKIPVLGSYMTKRKDQMLREKLHQMSQHNTIDVSDIVTWYRDDFIVACYRRLLARDPDPQGICVYQDMVRRGAPNEAIVYAISLSDEFLSRRKTILHIDNYRKRYKNFARKQKLLHIPIFGRIISLFLLSGQLERVYAQMEHADTSCLKEIYKLYEQVNRQNEMLTNCIKHWEENIAKLDNHTALIGVLSQKMDAQAGIAGKISGQMDEMPMVIHQANKASHSTVLGMPGGVIGVINDDFILGVPSEDWSLAMYLSTGGTFERGSEQFFEKQIRPQDTVLDIGANLGIYTLYALRKGCKVFSFEPTPRICSILKDNIHVNGYEVSGRSCVIEAAVSDVCGTATFYQNEGVCGQCSSLYRSSTDVTVEEITVQTLTLDSCREQFGSVDFIKIDVEGAEYFAFCGMRELLKENHNVKVIMEFAPSHMHRAGVKPEDLIDLIFELGFTIYKINETTAQEEPTTREELLQADSINLYLVREN